MSKIFKILHYVFSHILNLNKLLVLVLFFNIQTNIGLCQFSEIISLIDNSQKKINMLKKLDVTDKNYSRLKFEIVSMLNTADKNLNKLKLSKQTECPLSFYYSNAKLLLIEDYFYELINSFNYSSEEYLIKLKNANEIKINNNEYSDVDSLLLNRIISNLSIEDFKELVKVPRGIDSVIQINKRIQKRINEKSQLCNKKVKINSNISNQETNTIEKPYTSILRKLDSLTLSKDNDFKKANYFENKLFDSLKFIQTKLANDTSDSAIKVITKINDGFFEYESVKQKYYISDNNEIELNKFIKNSIQVMENAKILPKKNYKDIEVYRSGLKGEDIVLTANWSYNVGEFGHFKIGSYNDTAGFRMYVLLLLNTFQSFIENKNLINKTINAEIIGFADGFPINTLFYKGEFGNKINTDFYKGYDIQDTSKMYHIELTKGDSIKDNLSLAFLRAYGVYRMIVTENYIKSCNVKIFAFPTSLLDQGGTYRKVTICLRVGGVFTKFLKSLPEEKKVVLNQKMRKNHPKLKEPNTYIKLHN